MDFSRYDNEDFSKNVVETQNEIEGWLAHKETLNDIVLKKAETRNIIFLGRTRSGKSTVLRVLKNPYLFASSLCLFSETKEPQLWPFTVEYQSTGNSSIDTEDRGPVNFNINVIDTPGLYEVKEDIQEQRNDDMIKQTIAKCLEFEVTKLHCLFFVCSFAEGIKQEDIDAIHQMNSLFRGANKCFSLLITRSENWLPAKLRNIEKQVRAIPQLKPIFEENPEMKIFFSGSLSDDDYDSAQFESIRKKMSVILELRTLLYKEIIESTQEALLRDLDLYKAEKIRAADLAEEVGRLSSEIEAYKGTEEELESLKMALDKQTTQLEGALRTIATSRGEGTDSYVNIAKRGRTLVGDRPDIMNVQSWRSTNSLL